VDVEAHRGDADDRVRKVPFTLIDVGKVPFTPAAE
jgi:hypothetical protein